MDHCGCKVDHRFEAFVGFVASHGDAFEFLDLAEEIFDQVASFVNLGVDFEGRSASGMLRDHDLGLAFVQVFDDPVRVEGLVGDQAAEFDVLDQRRDAGGVEALARQQDEPHQIAERVGQRGDFRGPAAF